MGHAIDSCISEETLNLYDDFTGGVSFKMEDARFLCCGRNSMNPLPDNYNQLINLCSATLVQVLPGYSHCQRGESVSDDFRQRDALRLIWVDDKSKEQPTLQNFRFAMVTLSANCSNKDSPRAILGFQ